MTSTQPQPLFDNLSWMDNLKPNPVINEYLSSLQVENIEKEYALAKRFLLSYKGSQDTFNSYRREVERLCQWSWLHQGQSIKEIDRHAMEGYFEFVQKPPKSWVSQKHSQRFIEDANGDRVPNSEWRPFLIREQRKQTGKTYDGLSQATLRAIIAGTSTFFTYLQQENYLTQNPVLLIRQKSHMIQKQHQARITRKLSDEQWNILIKEVTKRCEKNSEFERHLFIFSAFYLMGIRISELADTSHHKPVMGDFFKDNDGLWWFRVIGKGNKSRDIAVCDDMIEQLVRYRGYLGLSAMPLPGEAVSILVKKRGHGGIGVRQLRKIVQEGFDIVIEELNRQSKQEDAQRMQQATVHWLRHTAISKDVQMRPREHVRDDAGHESVQITDRYIEIEMQERHASARSKKLMRDI